MDNSGSIPLFHFPSHRLQEYARIRCCCEVRRANRAELQLWESRGTCLEDIGDGSGILRRLSGRGDDGNGRPRHGGRLVLRVSTLC
jgi:hypothetical protein